MEQTRAAAQELLDGTTGDLAGAGAERFQALNRRAEQLREQEQQRVTPALGASRWLGRIGLGRLHRRSIYSPNVRWIWCQMTRLR